jgi:hypothetical protein
MIAVLQIIATLEDKIAMTGHKTKLPNARMKDGKLEIDGPRKKLPPHVKYAMDKRTKVKRGKRV